MSYIQGDVIKAVYAQIEADLSNLPITGVYHQIKTDIDENTPATGGDFPYLVFRSRSCELMNRTENSEIWRFPSVEFRFLAQTDVDADSAAEAFSKWFTTPDLSSVAGVKLIECQQTQSILPRANRWGWYAELRYQFIVDSPR